MCGRYALIGNPSDIEKRFGVQSVQFSNSTSYNITPGSMAPIIKNQDSQSVAVLAKWGLVPFWAKDPKIGYKLINARSESISQKPAFKQAFKLNRCLIPASGFFEWKRIENDKIPYFIHLKKFDLFSFAGLYDTWKDVEGRDLLTFTILTTQPNRVISDIHNRMPVILENTHEKIWLDPNTDTTTLTMLFKPIVDNNIKLYSISKNINNPENNNPDILKKIDYPINPKLL